MRIFISYAHVDRPIVDDWIVQKLRAGHYDIWIDERLFGGQNWQSQLLEAITNSDALIYAISPESIMSEVCQWEVAKAVELKKPIVPVLIQARTTIPDWLAVIQYVDFSNGATGDAVAKLIGGLQKLTSAQVPSAPQNPKIKTGGVDVKKPKEINWNFVLSLIGTLAAVIGTFVAVIAIIPKDTLNPTVPPVSQVSTPLTPVVIAQRDLDIRSGPGANFPRINILSAQDSLDILGISEDRLWYLVLLTDGTTGWVLASESGARLNGNRGVVNQMTLTPSVTPIPTNTIPPTELPTHTNTPSPTETSTPSYTPSSTLTPTNTLPPTETPPPTNTLVATVTFTTEPTQAIVPSATADQRAYPCDGTITNPDSSAVLINVVHLEASNSSTRGNAVRVGTILSIQRRVTASDAEDWFLIYDGGQRLGWIPVRYVVASSGCPS